MIGLTYASDASLARGCGTLQVGVLTALYAEPPAEPAQLSLDCLFLLPAFLPISRGDVTAATAWIAENACTIGSALDRLAGKCELIVTLDFPYEAHGPSGPSGREWLHSRSASDRAVSAAVDRGTEHLRAICAIGLTEDWMTITPLHRSGRAGAELGILTPVEGHRALATRLLAAARLTLRDEAQARLLLSGPWPPYGFVTQAMAPVEESQCI